ncbi:UNVERIFIED_CONTAM: hypothetical protein GTU68_012687 [Idotea baltica]|nr:hypothetical protein [Idotea baltica]
MMSGKMYLAINCFLIKQLSYFLYLVRLRQLVRLRIYQDIMN